MMSMTENLSDNKICHFYSGNDTTPSELDEYIDPGCPRYHRDDEIDGAGEECRRAVPGFSVGCAGC
jgi:hypothetical protein